eukprot:scaffold4132_cov56-Phaeocystis_antarctica.AAC.1
MQPSSKARVAATTRWPVSSVDNESFIDGTSRARDALRRLVDYCHQDIALAACALEAAPLLRCHLP